MLFRSQQIWDRDAEKLSVVKQNGFDVLVIWDSEYRKNKDEVVKKCVEFLGI